MIHAFRFPFHLARRMHMLVLAAYILLALALTYPLVAHFSDHVPGTTTWSMDEYGYVWNNWWFKHAVFERGVNPFQTNYILYPVGTSLVLYTFTLLHVLLGLPIQFAFGLIPASNAELLFAFVLSGYGAFLLARYLVRQMYPREIDTAAMTLAAFTGGAVFAFASNRFVYAALGHYNVVASEWMPFYILFLIKTVRETRWQNAGLAGLFAACALYVEPTHAALLVLFTLVYLACAGRAVWRRAVIARLLGVVGVAAILFAPLFAPMLSELYASGYTLPGWGHSEKLLVDLFGFFAPTSLHPLARGWESELALVRQGIARFVDVNTVFVGYVTLALASVAAIRFWRTLKVWAISAFAFAVLSLGPVLHIAGKAQFDFDGLAVTFPLPFLLLHYLPLIKENRVPNRFGVLVMLALAVLVACALAWTSQKLKTKIPRWHLLFVFAFLFLILFEHLSVPLPLTDARIPDVYAQIAREPGDFAVLTLPLGWRNSFGQIGAEDARTQYYQSAHKKFTFAANIQRNPPFLFEYFDRLPILHSLAEIEAYRPITDETLARDRALAPTLLAFFDVRFLVIQPAIPGRPPYSDTHDAAADYARAVLPLGDKVYERDGVIAYRVQQAPLPTTQVIAFGADTAYPYQAEGWGRAGVIADQPANWATQTDARVLFPVRELADYRVTLRALPYTFVRAPTQTLEIRVNDQPLQKFEMSPAWTDYTVTIPARLVRAGLNDLGLRFAYVARPRDVLPANFAIGATGATSPVDIVANSGDLGSIKVNGREASLLGRGYNVVVIDPRSGAVIAAKAYNTMEDRAHSRAMTDFLAQIPNGMIVAVAAQEQAGANLGERTVAGLQALGARIDLRAQPGNTHAFIGVKGAARGTAVEQARGDGAAFVFVGHAPEDTARAAAVTTIRIEKR